MYYSINFWFDNYNFVVLAHTGLGGKRGRDDDWIEQQDAFDQILAELNAKQGVVL